MIIILLGPPGVGKGTQGEILADLLGWERVVTGDLLRAHRREGTALGEEARKYMDVGELVPDDIIMEMVRERLKCLPDGCCVLFDGFPRTLPQAEALEDVLEAEGRRVERVVVMDAPDELLVKRISGRRSCPECGRVYNVHFNPPEEPGRCDADGAELVHRPDDDPETVRKRLEVYHEETEPVIGFYEERDAPVQHVDGNQPVDDVQAAVRAAVGGQATGGGQAEEHVHRAREGVRRGMADDGEVLDPAAAEEEGGLGHGGSGG